MHEDYLWDKTGSDPEIEKLENALHAFRCKESAPPAIPAGKVVFEKEKPRRFFQFGFAFAAFATVVIVSLGVWIQFSGTGKIAGNAIDTIASQKGAVIPDSVPAEKPYDTDFAVINVSTPLKNKPLKQIYRKNIIKIGKTSPLLSRKKEMTERVILAKDPILSLTKEERYAYNQLMIALSITSSKLKLVEDKINGVE